MASHPADHEILSNPYGGRGPLIMAVTWTQAGIALTLMAARTYTNGFLLKSFKWDYWWALITLVGLHDCIQINLLTRVDY